ncbi:hypothetical protein JTB14_026233 [Gonioctena quinquepunctata]|nr:hypothetical protein JTB14_026233 [Gonioctena quinquepunctata]
MINRLIELEEVVRSTVAILNTEVAQLSLEEWQILKELKKILEPFEDATRAVSGQQYMPASLVIVITGGPIEICLELLKDTTMSPVIETVVKQLENGLIERVGNTLAILWQCEHAWIHGSKRELKKIQLRL